MLGLRQEVHKRNIFNIYYWGIKEMCRFIVYFPQKTEKALILKHHDEQENPVLQDA